MIGEEKLEALLNATDKQGKKLIYKPEEGGKVYLDIDGSVRCLGIVLIGMNNILYTKFDDESNMFRATNAWSINFLIASNVDVIHYETRTHDYQITKQRAMEFGKVMHFSGSTELKLYVPLKYWEARHRGIRELNPKEYKWRALVGDSWYSKLVNTWKSDMVVAISKFVKEARRVREVYPESTRVFRALKLSTFEHTKVIILGQDPYHDGSADGLAFSYFEGSKKVRAKSLDVIFKEVERDCYDGMYIPYSYDLTHWARQGVLLLNTILTVEKGKPLSHANIGWERLTKIIIYELIKDPEPKVFLIWGKQAREHIDAVLSKFTSDIAGVHLYLKAPHPAADLYKRDQFGNTAPDYPSTFAGCSHFSEANKFLRTNNRKPITW